MEGPREAQWAPDPYRRHELRYWDGAQWTEHVSEGDGAILVDPPLPSPRGRRQAHTAADDVASLAEFVGGSPRTATRAADRLSVEHSAVVIPTPARGAPSSPSGVTDLRAPLPYGVPSSTGPVGRPVGAVDPGPRRAAPSGPAAGLPSGAPSRPRGDLFADLPGSAPQRAAAGSPPSGYVTAEADEGWDWRESRVPEILAGAAVAVLIAVAAFLGRGGYGGPAADVVEPVVSSPAAAQPTASAPGATKKPKKKTVPGAQVSSAKPGPIVRRTSSSTVRSSTSRTTAPTRTRSSSTSSSSSSTTSDAPSTTDKTPAPSTTPPADAKTSSPPAK